MPTANEVDNRPMAVGKWPRHRRTGRRYLRQQQQEEKFLSDDSRVLKYDSSCLDVLLRPQLLQEIYGDRGILSTSSNPLLEFCLDGGYLKDFVEEPPEELSPLLELSSEFATSFTTTWADNERRTDVFSDSSFLARMEHLCQTGCDINVQSSQGYTALHFILSGCTRDNFSTALRAAIILIRHGIDVTLKDKEGSDVFNFLSKLLERKLFSEVFALASLILQQSRCDVNSVDVANRSLLSHSVTHGDATSDLTRLLLNHGGKILPYRIVAGSDANDVARERDASAFTWLLRSVIRQQMLSGYEITLQLLCHEMAEAPELMRTHVLTTMLQLGQECHGATSAGMASLFIALKNFMSPYWSQPLRLRHLCVMKIRHALGPKNIIGQIHDLNLPSSLISDLHLK